MKFFSEFFKTLAVVSVKFGFALFFVVIMIGILAVGLKAIGYIVIDGGLIWKYSVVGFLIAIGFILFGIMSASLTDE